MSFPNLSCATRSPSSHPAAYRPDEMAGVIWSPMTAARQGAPLGEARRSDCGGDMADPGNLHRGILGEPGPSRILLCYFCCPLPFATQGPAGHFECEGSDRATVAPLLVGTTGELCFAAPPIAVGFLGPPMALWAEAG